MFFRTFFETLEQRKEQFFNRIMDGFVSLETHFKFAFSELRERIWLKFDVNVFQRFFNHFLLFSP